MKMQSKSTLHIHVSLVFSINYFFPLFLASMLNVA